MGKAGRDPYPFSPSSFLPSFLPAVDPANNRKCIEIRIIPQRERAREREVDRQAGSIHVPCLAEITQRPL